MKLKRILPAVISLLFLTAAICLKAGLPPSVSQTKQPTVTVSKTHHQQPQELRGVWVTYMTLDVENETDKRAIFDKKIDTIIRDMKSGGFNTMIVQVRPFCDAIYPSVYYPWSHIISGEQGIDPGFDPLKLIVDKCRKNNLFIHAWINPYRVSTEKIPQALSDDNPCVKNDSLGLEINGCLYLDPASKAAQELIADGVRELVENYDIDGIQFDDYFYPENCGDFDAEDYQNYLDQSGIDITLDAFRKMNVNNMVKAAYQAAHQADSSILFGISPQGNLQNNDTLSADVRTWCAQEGYIDYICPQIYFSLDNPSLTFEDCLSEWLALKKHDGLKLFIGLAGYKAGTDADEGTWLDNSDILLTELRILQNAATDGFILYSYDSIHDDDNKTEIENVIRYLTTEPTQNSSKASVNSTS